MNKIIISNQNIISIQGNCGAFPLLLQITNYEAHYIHVHMLITVVLFSQLTNPYQNRENRHQVFIMRTMLIRTFRLSGARKTVNQ